MFLILRGKTDIVLVAESGNQVQFRPPPPVLSIVLAMLYGVSPAEREPKCEPSPVANYSALKTALDRYSPARPLLDSIGKPENRHFNLGNGDHFHSRSAGWMKACGTENPDQAKRPGEQDNQGLPPVLPEVFFTRLLKTAKAAHKPLTPAAQSRTLWRAA